MMAKRSPPTPTIIGSTTLSTAAEATAASTALPPCWRMRSPACDASGWLVTTIPRRAMTSDRLCASHPSARSPRTPLQNAGAGVALHGVIVNAGVDWPRTTATTPSARPATAAIAVSTRGIAARPAGATVGDREAAVVAGAELDPRAVIARAEVEIGDDRVGKVFGAVDERLVQLPHALDLRVLAQRHPRRRRTAFVRPVVHDGDARPQ